MKRSILILAVAMASLAAVAKPPQAVPSTAIPATSTPVQPAANPSPSPASSKLPPAAVSEKQTKLKFFTPLKVRGPIGTDKVYRVDGESTQPWGRMIGSHPGYSAFAQPETALRGFDVFSFGGDPLR